MLAATSACTGGTGIKGILENPDLVCDKRVEITGHVFPAGPDNSPFEYTLMDDAGNQIAVATSSQSNFQPTAPLPALGQHLRVTGSAACVFAGDGKQHVLLFREYARENLPGDTRVVAAKPPPTGGDPDVTMIGCLTGSPNGEVVLAHGTELLRIERKHYTEEWIQDTIRHNSHGEFGGASFLFDLSQGHYPRMPKTALKAASEAPLGSVTLPLASGLFERRIWGTKS